MADPMAGAALGGVAGAALGGPAGAVAGAALGVAVANGSVPGKRGTVHSPRMAAARASKTAKAPRKGVLAAIGQEVRDRLHARGERRLDARRPGSPDTVRFTWRTPRPDGGKVVEFVRPGRPVQDTEPTPEPPARTADTETHRGRGARQDPSAPGVPTAPATAGDPIAPEGAERSRTIMPTSRYTISLEPPTTDGEFLEQSQAVAQALSGLAEQVEQWTDSLAALNMPAPILADFLAIPEALQEAAGRAVGGAQRFQEHFEEARNVAQRGMRIEGTDAA